MKKTARKRTTKEAPKGVQLTEPLAAFVRQELRSFVIAQGMIALATMLEEDRTALCGEPYARGKRGGPKRAGTAPGELVMGGRRVRVKRPRARDEEGEVTLPSWAEFAATDPLGERALEQMVVGVSTRKYARSLEDVPEEVATRGTSRSAVSRRFKAMTQKQLDELMSRDLSDLAISTVMIDGIHFEEHVVVLAVGIDEGGQKHPLGLWEGATENGAVCISLLNDLVTRGLDAQRSMLFAIDGSKALRSAIGKIFGKRALVQRCQEHKRRNVLGHLPKEMHPSVRKAIGDAYRSASATTAKTRLKRLASSLEDDHPGAAASLREGLDETLTVKALGLCLGLERTLSTTNLIENLNGGIRDVTRRVKRWRGGSMILRWVAAAVVDRARSFRRLRGYRSMPKLVAELRRNDARLDPVEPEAEVA